MSTWSDGMNKKEDIILKIRLMLYTNLQMLLPYNEHKLNNNIIGRVLQSCSTRFKSIYKFRLPLEKNSLMDRARLVLPFSENTSKKLRNM